MLQLSQKYQQIYDQFCKKIDAWKRYAVLDNGDKISLQPV